MPLFRPPPPPPRKIAGLRYASARSALGGAARLGALSYRGARHSRRLRRSLGCVRQRFARRAKLRLFDRERRRVRLRGILYPALRASARYGASVRRARLRTRDHSRNPSLSASGTPSLLPRGGTLHLPAGAAAVRQPRAGSLRNGVLSTASASLRALVLQRQRHSVPRDVHRRALFDASGVQERQRSCVRAAGHWRWAAGESPHNWGYSASGGPCAAGARLGVRVGLG